MEVNGNAEHHANIPEWGLEDLTGSVLYDVFYESTTMLAGRMLAQQRLAAARGDRDGERRAEMDRRGMLAARGKVDPTDRETLIRLKRENDSARAARTEAVAPWHAIGGSLAVDVEGIWRDDIRPVVDAAERSDKPCTVFVGGQPGAGKTRATHLVRVSGLHDGPLLPVNGDDLRQYHPDYDRLCDEEPLNMPERTARASAAWIRMTMEYVDADGIPAIVEGTWRNAATVLGEAANAKRHGRSTHAVVLAVPPVLSRIAILERYYRDRSAGLPARWTPASAHENAVRNLPDTVWRIATSPLIDRFTVIGRDGGILFDGTGDRKEGGWDEWRSTVSWLDRGERDAQFARIDFLERAWSAFTPDNDDARMLLDRIHKTIRPKVGYNAVYVMDDYEELMRGADPRVVAKAREGRHWDPSDRFFVWSEPDTGYLLGEKLYDVPEDDEGALYSFPADSPLIWDRCFNWMKAYDARNQARGEWLASGKDRPRENTGTNDEGNG